MSFEQIQEEILHTFPYGSHVYGTNTENSDEDFIVVVKGESEKKYGIHGNNQNITVYSEVTFRRLLKEHDIAVMECVFSNETNYEFQLNLEQLRRSVSGVIYNSFIKYTVKPLYLYMGI